MNSSAQPARSFSFQANLRGTPATLLTVAAMAVGFMWASGHDDQRCVEMVLLAVLMPLMLARTGMVDQIAWMGKPARYCIGAFFALGAISTLNAFSLRHAIYEWTMLLLLLLVAASLAAELARAGSSGLETVLRWVLAIGVLYSLRIAIWYGASLATGIKPHPYDLAVGFSNIRFFNHVQTVLLPLAVLLYMQAASGSFWRRASFALAACWWAFLFVTQARASILGLGAGCVFVFAVRRSSALGFLKAMALSALAGMAVYVLVFMLLPMLAGLPAFSSATDVMQRTAADPTSGRNFLWKLALELVTAHPLLGAGPHHFAHEGAKLGWGAHPHNFIMQIGAEWGLLALLCLLGAIGIGMRSLIRSGTRIEKGDLSGQQTLAVMLATGAAILVDGLFSGVIVMPQSQMAIVLYLGCAGGWVRSLDQGAAPAASAPLRWLSACLAAVALCGLAYAVAPSVVEHASHGDLTPAEKAANPSTHWPRIWEAGYF